MKHEERRVIRHTPKNLFNLVADVKKYPEFLPWCLGARIKNKTNTSFEADLLIGFSIYKEIYSSKVFLDEKKYKILVEYKDGPFEYLQNYWIFQENPAGCKIEFMVDFKFKSVFLQTLMETLFNEAVKKMVKAFESRANELYH